MDITYLDCNDSATVNFTYTDKESINPETITIAYGSWQYQTTVKQIFIDLKKSEWNYRYTFNIPFDYFPLFFRAKDPVITITTDSDRTVPLHAVKQWKKNAEINHLIIQIIQKNKTPVRRQ